MPQISDAYCRRKFMEQFARMSFERREGTIEALVVLHETALSKAQLSLDLTPEQTEEEETI